MTSGFFPYTRRTLDDMASDRERVYEVIEPMQTFNVFLVKASSREDAERRVRDQDEDSIICVEMAEVVPSMRRWTVRWMRGWRP